MLNKIIQFIFCYLTCGNFILFHFIQVNITQNTMITHKHRKYIEIRCLHDFVTQHKFEFEWIFIVHLVFFLDFLGFCLFVCCSFFLKEFILSRKKKMKSFKVSWKERRKHWNFAVSVFKSPSVVLPLINF